MINDNELNSGNLELCSYTSVYIKKFFLGDMNINTNLTGFHKYINYFTILN